VFDQRLDICSVLSLSSALYKVATGMEGSSKLDFVQKRADIVKLPRSLLSHLADTL
jgi:hypothetical protein